MTAPGNSGPAAADGPIRTGASGVFPPLPEDSVFVNARALLSRSRLFGRISAVIFLFAFIAVGDALQTLMRHEFNSVDIVPGETILLSGMMPADAKDYTQLSSAIEGTEGLHFTPTETYKGFWMGGHMWRAELSAAPDARAGTAVLTIEDIIKPRTGDAAPKTAQEFEDRDRAILYGGQQNPALVFGITVWPSESARREGDTSLFRRLFGLPAFGVAAGCIALAVLCGLANWRAFSLAEAALAGHGIFSIHGLKLLSGAETPGQMIGSGGAGFQTAFARMGQSFASGEPVILYDRTWTPRGRGRMVRIDKLNGYAVFPRSGARPQHGWVLRREGPQPV